MAQRIDVPGMGIVEFPDGMSNEAMAAAIQASMPKPKAEPPSRMATFGNAVAKGAAGFGDMIGNGIVNTANLGLAGRGALTGEDMTGYMIPSDKLSGFKKIGEATGLIDEKRDPQDMTGRMIDMTGQVIGGGGVNPAAVARSAGRGAIMPIVRDLTAATVGGAGAGAGQELTRNVNTGSESADRAIKLAATLAGGAVPSAVLAARGTAGDRAAAATQGITPEQWAEGIRRQRLAAEAGAPITGYEALQGGTGINPKMQTQQRLAEQSDHGAPLVQMAQNRNANNAAYADRVINQVAPAEALPDVLAGQLQTSATDSIQAARNAGNARAAPHYAASSNNPAVRIPPHAWNNLATDPAIAWALEQTRNNPLLGVQGAAEGSLQWLDAAKKFLDSRGQSLAQQGDRFPAGQAAAAATRITNAVDPVVPAYARARSIVADNMRNVVTPMENSQIGKLSESNDFRRQAANLLPENPLDVTPAVIDRTVRTLSQQDPEIVRRFVAQYMRGVFNESNGGGVSNNSMGGYQFAKKVADNPGQQHNLVQAIESSGAHPGQFLDALDVFRSQGMRPPVNSATVANASEGAALHGKLADLLMHPLRTVSGGIDSWRNGMATRELSAALSDPNSVQRIQELARSNGTYNPLTQQMLAQMLLSSRQNSGLPTAGQ